MGANKNIKTPTELMQLYVNYVQYLKDNPRIQSIANYGKVTPLERERPQTMKGFLNYAREQGKSCFHYFNNTDNRYYKFIDVCQDIKLSIEADMLELGLLGLIKESMTSKILGMNERLEINYEGLQILNIDPLD
jgi:hypothetical protein